MANKIEESMCIERKIRFKGNEGFQLLQMIEEEADLCGVSQNEVIIRSLKKDFKLTTNSPISVVGQVEELHCDMPDCQGHEVVGRGYWRLNNSGWRNLCLRHYFEAVNARFMGYDKQSLAWTNVEWTYQGSRKLCYFAKSDEKLRGCGQWAAGKIKRVSTGEVLDVCPKCAKNRMDVMDKWLILTEALPQ